jgi:hypothetical protein
LFIATIDPTLMCSCVNVLASLLNFVVYLNLPLHVVFKHLNFCLSKLYVGLSCLIRNKFYKHQGHLMFIFGFRVKMGSQRNVDKKA